MQTVLDLYKNLDYYKTFSNINTEVCDYFWNISKNESSSDPYAWFVFDRSDLSKKKYIIVWEAPWKEEVVNNTPFQWIAWKNLRNIVLKEYTEEGYFTNIFKYRPITQTESWYKNRTPNKKEINTTKTFLEKELEFYIKEYWINTFLLVWQTAFKWFLSLWNINEQMKIIMSKEWLKDYVDCTNKFFEVIINNNTIRIFPIYHTSPLVFNFKEKREKILEWISLFKLGI